MNSSAGLKEEMRCEKYLISWRDEANIRSPYYFENDEIASMLRSSPPPMSQVLKTLNENGKASRTHFSPTGFKTDIPPKEVISLISDLQKAHSE
jgi:tRNA (guanine26-N2/guanine27-N2)-dimethyltransferase